MRSLLEDRFVLVFQINGPVLAIKQAETVWFLMHAVTVSVNLFLHDGRAYFIWTPWLKNNRE